MRRGWGLCFDSGCGWAWAWGRWNGEEGGKRGEGNAEGDRRVVGVEAGYPMFWRNGGGGSWDFYFGPLAYLLARSYHHHQTLASKPFFPSSGSNNRLLDAYVWPQYQRPLEDWSLCGNGRGMNGLSGFFQARDCWG